MTTLPPGRIEKLRFPNTIPEIKEIFVFHDKNAIVSERVLEWLEGVKPFP
jgi:hypothetical protein